MVCLLFFQLVLLLGYLYAHLLSRHIAPRTQGWLHAGLLAASLLVLPILPKDSLKPPGPEHPALHILWVLALTVGFPFFLLSATSPLLQAWLLSTRKERDRKSTRLNSSHGYISYAVFCLKKKLGTHYVLAVIDAHNTIVESDETNDSNNVKSVATPTGPEITENAMTSDASDVPILDPHT